MTTKDDRGLVIDGETVVWSGRPAQGLLFTSRDWLLIPFSLIWCGFSIFWETTVLSLPTAPLFMKLFGAAFVLMGLYFVAGRFLLDAWVRSGTQYAITNNRVLINRSWPFAKFTALSLKSLAGNEPSGKGERPGRHPLWSFNPQFLARQQHFRLDSFARSDAGVHRHRKRPRHIRATSKRPRERRLALETMRRLAR